MDDVPAGPASPGPRRPSLSVVVPVRNGGRDFERCLRRLRDSRLADFELIVVDDGSTDDSAAVAERAGAIVVRFPSPQGPAAARNRGAREASAPLIFFLDADVAVHPETLDRAMARFAADPGLSALFGSYDDAPQAPGVVSQYRNLLHHFVHQQGAFEARHPPGAHLLDRLRHDPARGVPGLRRLRPPALPPPGHRGHRAGIPAHPRRPPDRAGARRPGDPPEAVDPQGDGPHRHLPPRRALDAPDQAERDRRDRPERQGRRRRRASPSPA